MKIQSEDVDAAGADSTVIRIVDAAEELFAQNSYEGTTLRQIALQVGIKEPSIYGHFVSKEAIYSAVIDRALRPFHSQLDSWINTDLTLKDLFDIPKKILELHAEHPFAARILHREFCNPVEKISPKIMEWLEQIAVQSATFIGSLPEQGGPLQDRRRVVINIITLTNITLGFFSSQGMQALLLGPDYDQEKLFDEHVKIVSKIFRSLII